MQERWATFDCYGTLIDWHAGIRAAFHQLWPDADPARLLRRYEAVEPLVQESRDMTYRDVCARALRAVSAVEGLTLEAADEYALTDSLPTWRVFPEVPAALRTLRADGWHLAILSNTDPELLAASVDHIGVPIDVQVTAREAHSYKPAPGHWQHFFEQTGADPANHVHVAASAFHDLAAAQQLHLKAVWINRLAAASDFPRDAELTDLERLPETLNRLVPGA